MHLIRTTSTRKKYAFCPDEFIDNAFEWVVMRIGAETNKPIGNITHVLVRMLAHGIQPHTVMAHSGVHRYIPYDFSRKSPIRRGEDFRQKVVGGFYSIAHKRSDKSSHCNQHFDMWLFEYILLSLIINGYAGGDQYACDIFELFVFSGND